MRKIILTIFPLFISITMSAQILSKDAFEANKKWSIGILAGAHGVFDDKARGVFGLNLTIKGIYLDFLGKGSSHKSDVRVDKWKESSGTVFHLGYQIPLTRALRIIPIVGYYTLGKITTDGYDWKVTSSGISNKTYTSVDSRGVDYGGILVINIKHVNIYAAGTAHTLYGGVAYQF